MNAVQMLLYTTQVDSCGGWPKEPPMSFPHTSCVVAAAVIVDIWPWWLSNTFL